MEVVSRCDVDKHCSRTPRRWSRTGRNRRRPPHLRRLPRVLAEKRPRRRPDRHARPLARAADDRRLSRPGPTFTCRSRSASTSPGRPRPCSRRRGSTSGSSRSAPSCAECAPHHRGPRPRPPRRAARQDRPGRDLLLLPHAGAREPTRCQGARPSRLRDVDRSCRISAIQLDRPPEGLAGVHRIQQRHRGRHVHPHVRHGRLDDGTGLAPEDFVDGGDSTSDKASKANISDTQTAAFDFGDFPVVWEHRTWGHSADPQYPWGATIYGDKGTLKVSVPETGRPSRRR